MVNINSQKQFTDEIVYYILSRVSGTHPDDEIIEEKPSNHFLIGTLAAKKEQMSEEEIKIDDEGKAASIRASRLKVSILTNKSELNFNPILKIKAMGSVYYKIKVKNSSTLNRESDLEYEKEKHKWKRLNFFHECNISQNSSIHIDFSQLRKKANYDPNIIKKIPNNLWSAKIFTKISSYNNEDSLISVYYENDGSELDQFEGTLFDCKLEVDINNIKIKEFCDEYLYEEHKQRYYYDFRTVNCQVKWIEKPRRFLTEHFGIFEQDNIRPREGIPDVNLSLQNLMNPKESIPSLDIFLENMRNYLEIYKNGIPDNVKKDEFQPRFLNKQTTWGERIELITHFEKLINRIETGINLIRTNSKVRESFLKTNETFNNYYINQGISEAGWRLFQLAFFLSSIESVVEETDLDIVDVLHVDTGGGKSEAYFALVIFTSFYERSIGKKNGVSAIVKFPLRMLSIQQLERISSVIIHAEIVRKKHLDKFPGDSFSLGYYVGSREDDFPDLYTRIKKNLYENDELVFPPPISKIISKCPLCPKNSKGNIHLIDDLKGKRILHQCDKCKSIFYIYFSDREVFRWRPTVIVSTVDKWAGLSQQRRVRNLLGGNGSMCPDEHGFIPSGDKCEDKEEEDFQCLNIGENKKNSAGPRLSIQDEMHLLSEGFGTISSHFEGLIEAIVENNSDRKLKHITMSATLNGTEKQIGELYNKSFFVIPGRCPEGSGSQNDFFFEKKEGPKRIIFGLKPNLRDNHYASLRSLLHFSEFIINAQKELNSNSQAFCDKYELNDISEAQDLINQYLIPLTYHLKKQDAYDIGRLKDAVVGDRLKKFYSSDIKGKVLTGDSSLDELKETIDKIREFVLKYDPFLVDNEGLIFEPLYATSVVSHGVDLDELNFMIFQGLPYSTSEYIQALSRVGRKNLGIILLWFYPNRVRDDSFYRNFVRYHNSLDHEVRPIPINRSSRLGLQQTINSIFCAGIINYLSNKKGKPFYLKSHIGELTLSDQEDLIEFVKQTYGKNGLDLNIPFEIEKRINQITIGDSKDKEFFPNILAKSGDPFFRNQSGMRGIQKQLILEIKPENERILKQKEK